MKIGTIEMHEPVEIVLGKRHVSKIQETMWNCGVYILESNHNGMRGVLGILTAGTVLPWPRDFLICAIK